MGNRHREADMPHSLSTDLRVSNLDSAAVADNAPKSNTLIFSARALEVLYRTEYPLAEETFTLRLEGSVIDRFRLRDLSV
jgi:hypothetical protein